mmetsp:Transcript_847/g.1986  ORF Transcript_847/g.1986 Transcript_847/m.1986 type:complete len:111 (-) Transcript_847:8-340(-)
MHENVFQEACLAKPSSCKQSHEYHCSVNITTTAYKTVYEYALKRNLTDKLLEYEGVEKNVTGLILRWNIADLFDVPTWHYASTDCTHFTYVPPLFEAAFHRLHMLLTQVT